MEGTARKDRENKRAPKAKRGRPRAPSWLNDDALKMWDEMSELLDGMQVLTRADGKVLAVMCDQWARWRDMQDWLDEEGSTYTTVNSQGVEMHRPRPEAAQAGACLDRFIRLSERFGLTPVDRERAQRRADGDDSEIDKFKRKHAG